MTLPATGGTPAWSSTMAQVTSSPVCVSGEPRSSVGGADDRAEAEGKAVCDLPRGGPEGLPQGQGQQGGSRGRRGVDRGVREGPRQQPLQALESDGLGELPPTASAGGRHTEKGRAGFENARRAHRGGPHRPDGGEDAPGARGGANLPSRLLRLPAGALGPRCAGHLPEAV